MRDEMFFIDGELVDLDDDTKITLNIKSNLFTDLSKIVSNNSYTIKLPKTVRNQRIIEHADLPACGTDYPRKFHQGRYFRNGVEIVPDAKVALISVSDAIEMAMTWGNSTAFQSLVDADYSLRNLNEVVDGVSRYLTWKNWGENDRNFPLVNYGFRSDETTVWYHPAVSLGKILGYISTDFGVTFDWPEEKIHILDDLFIPLLTRNPSDGYAENCAVTVKIRGVYSDNDQNVSLYFYGDVSGTSYYGRMNVLRGNPPIGNVFSSYQSYIDNASPIISGNFEVQVKSSSEPSTALLDVCAYSFNGSGSELDTGSVIEVTPFSMEDIGNGVYKLVFDFTDNQASVFESDLSRPHFKFLLRNIGDASNVVSISGTIKIKNIEEEVLIQSADGNNGRFWIIPNLPDIKVIDFIKIVASLMGVFAASTEKNVLRFITIDKLLDKVNAYDWTKRVVASYQDNKPMSMSYTLDDFAQKNNYKWKEDDTVRGNYDGCLVVENSTIDDEIDVLELPFAPTNMVGGVANIPLYTYDEDTGLQYNSVEPRLLRYDGNRGVFNGLDWKTILSDNYKAYQQIILRPVIITEKVEISDIELREIDVTVPVYLAQYGRYYAIMSIKAENTGICECELLQLEV